MKKAAKIIVKGTVQGIFFRQFIKDHADKLKLTGFCRNLEGGDVEIIVEGEPDQIERMARFAKEGPEHAQIRSAEVSERKWTGSFREFKVLRF
jgi:acylphosphatase